MTGSETQVGPERDRLSADCARCSALCCVAFTLTASTDFAIDKPSGAPCPNLGLDFRCTIHGQLRTAGFGGCAAYDCFGAGQQVTASFEAVDWWHKAPNTPSASEVLAEFDAVRHLNELQWYLLEVLDRPELAHLHTRCRHQITRIRALVADVPQHRRLDASALQVAVDAVLSQASEDVRDPAGPDHRHADLTGASLHGSDLRRAQLRGAYLMGADLRAADLRSADLIGADLRGARLDDADLSTALYLTREQVAAASGNLRTRLPAHIPLPAHWR